MSALETRTFRAESLEEALGAVRRQLGPEAIVVRQREGIVGGIGGFFGKRCVEIDVECPPPAQKPSAVPPRAVANAYSAADTDVDEVEGDGGDDDPSDFFRNLLSDSSLFASTLADAIEREPEPEPEPAEDDEPAAFEPLEPLESLERVPSDPAPSDPVLSDPVPVVEVMPEPAPLPAAEPPRARDPPAPRTAPV
jgi:hypothetical protein